MKDIFKIEKIKAIVFGIVLIVFGILFCFLPEKSISFLQIVVSSFLIVYGVIVLLGFVFSPAYLMEPFMLVQSIFMIGTGVLLDIFPSLFVLGIGLIILIGGIKRIVSSVGLKREKENLWWIDLTIGIVIGILGLLCAILCETNLAVNIVSILLGVTLILNGTSYLVLIFALKREIRKIKKSQPIVTFEVKEGEEVKDNHVDN